MGIEHRARLSSSEMIGGKEELQQVIINRRKRRGKQIEEVRNKISSNGCLI
jgi:hypothetical protein